MGGGGRGDHRQGGWEYAVGAVGKYAEIMRGKVRINAEAMRSL